MPLHYANVIKNRTARRAALAAFLATVSFTLPLLESYAQQPINRYRAIRDRVLNRLAPRPEGQPPLGYPQDQEYLDYSNHPKGTENDRPTGSSPTRLPSQGAISDLSNRQGGAAEAMAGQVSTTSIDRSGTTAAPQKVATPQGGNQPINVATEEERNQVIAPDWKDPWVVFFVTGKQSGYLEPCGCTGLENQKGGLMRRDSLLETIRTKGWDVLPIDTGSQVRMRGKQSEIKFDWTAKALSTMNYAAVGYGEDDLRLSQDTLVYQLVNVGFTADGESNPLFVSANVSIFGDLDTKYKIVEVKGRKIGITTVLGDEAAEKLKGQADFAEIKSAATAAAEVFEELQREKCDFYVLVANATLEESRALAQKVPGFQLIVTAGGYGEPTYRPEVIPGTNAQMVQVGTKGMYAGIVGLFDDPKEPMRYQRLALSSQFTDSPRIVELFHKYQDQLRVEGMERLGKRPQNHPTLREFVGSEKCGECHSSAFEVWKNSGHAHATESIVNPPERGIARNFDPECLSCHVTGWNPQEFFPYKTGFVQVDSTPHLTGNGCENCHGPGHNHVAAESGDIEADTQMLIKLRKEMQLTLDQAQDKCLECHDIDNSPDFHRDGAFEEYWEKIKHYGKD